MNSFEVGGSACPERIIVMGDLQGDYSVCVGALIRAGLISALSSLNPDDYHTITWLKEGNQKTHLVQVGDVFDGAIRCPLGSIPNENEEGILDLLIHLKSQAKLSNGWVHLIAGNHEIMNICLNYRYVSPNGFLNFEKYALKNLECCDEDIKIINPYYYGALGRSIAFSKGGVVRKKMEDNFDAVVKIGEHLFVHAGITKKLAERFEIDEINQIFKSCIREDDLNDSQFSQLFFDDRSIVWLRDYIEFNEQSKDELSDVLNLYKAKYLYSGHNVQEEGIKFKSLKDGRGVWLVDPGMSGAFQGRKEILEINGSSFRVLSFEVPVLKK